MPSTQTDEEDDAVLAPLVQKSLSCDWRPRTESSFNNTRECVRALLEVLTRNTPVYGTASSLATMPVPVLEKILVMSLTAGGDPVRSILQRVCRLFRCILFDSDDAWKDASTFSCVPPEFAIALMRSRWTGIPYVIHLDESNRGRQSSIPPNSLIYSVAPDVSSMHIEHSLSNIGVLRMFTKTRHYPDLVDLVLDSDAIFPGSVFPHPASFQGHFPPSGPLFFAPNLRSLRLTAVYCALPVSKQIRRLSLSGRILDIVSDDEDDPPEVNFVIRNQWPKALLYSTLLSQNHLTSLKLTDAVSEMGLGENFGTIDLPSLKSFLVISAHTQSAAWILSLVECSPDAYICVRVGHGATKALNLHEVFAALESHARERRFTTLVAMASVYITALLFGPDPRTPGPTRFEDTSKEVLFECECPHATYPETPGCIDVHVVWDSPSVDEPTFDDMFDAALPYIDTLPVRILELNEELPADVSNGGFPFDAIITEHITELRFWRDEFRTILDHLVMVCTGCTLGKKKTISARRLVELMLEIFPSVWRVVDLKDGRVWEADTTCELVDLLVCDWQFVNGLHE